MRTLIIAALLVCSTASAQECRQRTLSVKPFYMPTGLFCQIGEEGMTCFTLEEYKQLLKMDAELHASKEKVVEYEQLASNQALILNQQKIVIETLEKDKQVLEGQVARVGAKWEDCLHEQEGIPWSSIGLGAAAGVIVGVIAGVVSYLVLASPDRAE